MEIPEDPPVEEGKEQLDDIKFKVPETKRPENYFNIQFEEMNKKRKELLYSSATPYSTRAINRSKGFVFPR